MGESGCVYFILEVGEMLVGEWEWVCLSFDRGD